MKTFAWSSLGKVKYGGEVYYGDIIVSSFQEVFPRQTDEEHTLTRSEVERSIDDGTKILMVGTGEYGVLKVPAEVKEYCKKNKIKLVVGPTREIIEKYNKKMRRRGRKPGITVILHVER